MDKQHLINTNRVSGGLSGTTCSSLTFDDNYSEKVATAMRLAWSNHLRSSYHHLRVAAIVLFMHAEMV